VSSHGALLLSSKLCRSWKPLERCISLILSTEFRETLHQLLHPKSERGRQPALEQGSDDARLLPPRLQFSASPPRPLEVLFRHTFDFERSRESNLEQLGAPGEEGQAEDVGVDVSRKRRLLAVLRDRSGFEPG